MKLIKKLLFVFTVSAFGHLQSQITPNSCNVIVVNTNDEQNAVFINTLSGAKAAIDIPMEPGSSMVISQVKVTLASVEVPTFAHLRFYDSVTSIPDPEDPEDVAHPIPGQTLFTAADTQIINVEELGYEETYGFTIRRLTLQLASPIALSGAVVNGRYWMGVISDANAWATTPVADLIGESVHTGSTIRAWSPITGFEALYEFTAECNTLGIHENGQEKSAIWPNPAKDFISISLTPGHIVSKVVIYNSAAQQIRVVDSGFNNISVTGFPQGVYVLKTYTTNGNVYNSKFVKR